MIPALEKDAYTVAERLRKSVLNNVMAPNGKPVTLSMGLASLRGGEDTGKKVYARADVAMYEAKERGRNRIVQWEVGMPEEKHAGSG